MKTSVFIATSLDGYIARPDGAIDWLNKVENNDPTEDFGYGSFMKPIDGIVMGRNTFEQVLTFDQWPYNVPVIVLTHRSLDLPKEISSNVQTQSGQPTDIVEELSEEGFQHLYIDGGVTIQQFLRAGLIDDLTITRIPVIIGEGLSLFGPMDDDIPLHHVTTTSYDNGLVQSTYQVIK